MTDFEEQVGATLAAVAEEAPDASGLAAGARRRHRVRRQRRIAVGGVAAALVVAVSAVALGARDGGSPDIAEDPTETPSAAWQTISEGDLRASLPPDWKAYDCAGDNAAANRSIYAAPGEDPCADGRGTSFEEFETYEPLDAAGVVVRRPGDGRAYWTAYVHVDEWIFNVTSADRDLTRQILATARLDGQPVIDGSQWVSFERNGIGYDIPAFWGVGEKGDRSGYAVCAVPGAADEGSGEQLDDRHYGFNRPFGNLQVTVTAPTQAVAEIVWASLNEAPDAVGGGCVEEDFHVGLLPPEGGPGKPVEGQESGLDTITFDDIVMEVPSSWSVKDECGDFVEYSPGGAKCTDLGEGVRFLKPVPDYRYGEGVIVQEDVDDGLTLWTGYVERGDYAVVVRHPDRAIVELLLSEVRS